MISYQKAIKIINKVYLNLPNEKISVSDSLNRVCAKNILSPSKNPLANNTAFDGFAVLAKETRGLSKKKIKKFAIRVSDYESFENVYKIHPNCKWIWLEIFKKINLKKKDLNYIKKNKIKICLVSPELHNKKKDLLKIKKFVQKNKIKIYAVCTKFDFIKFWEN